MDVEGSEVFARGMQNALGRTQALVVEFIGHHLQRCRPVTVEISWLRFDLMIYVPSSDHHAPW